MAANWRPRRGAGAPVSDPALRVGTRVGNLDHVESIHRDTFNEVRVCAEQPLEQLRPKRRRVAILPEFFLAVEEQVDGDPERPRVLGADMSTDITNLSHFRAPVPWCSPDRSTRYEPVRNRRERERHGGA